MRRKNDGGLIGVLLGKATEQFKFYPMAFCLTLVAIVLIPFVGIFIAISTPYLEFYNGMAVQQKGKAQSEYGWYKRRKEEDLGGNRYYVARQPVAGTIARGEFLHPAALAAATEENMYAAPNILKAYGITPIKPTTENILRGHELFDIYCYVCHGKDGAGKGPVVGAGRFPAPPSLHTDKARNLQDGSIYQIITRGKGNMHGYAEKITPVDRWAVINYLRALQIQHNR